MKKYFRGSLAFLALLVIFMVSFVIGRVTAVKDGREKAADAIREAERAVEILPLLRASDPEPLFDDDSEDADTPEIHAAKPDEEVEEERQEPPCPIPYPVDGVVIAPYSLQSVYSLTMGDWRAHTGMDIEAPPTSAVKASADGTVTAAYEDKLWGKVIEIEHQGGLKTVYKGLSTLEMVSVGQNVSAGAVISGVGDCPVEGKSESHLHLETWLDGVCVNPECYVMDQ